LRGLLANAAPSSEWASSFCLASRMVVADLIGVPDREGLRVAHGLLRKALKYLGKTPSSGPDYAEIMARRRNIRIRLQMVEDKLAGRHLTPLPSPLPKSL